MLLGEAIATSALERTWSAKELSLLMRDAALVAADGIDGLAARAFVAAVRSPATLVLPADRAIEVQLALLAAFADVPEASLWLAADSPAPDQHLHLVPVVMRGTTQAALVLGDARASASASSRSPRSRRSRSLRWSSTSSSARALAQERMAAEAGERLSVRLGFDLHDGPLQEFAALNADLRLLRAQIAEAPPDVVRGRIDDALGLLGSVERHVRDLARSVDSSALVGRPFAELLRDEVSEAAAHGLAVTVEVDGNVDGCTPSQRIALLRVVHEALSNVVRPQRR